MTDTVKSLNGNDIAIQDLKIGDRVLATDFQDRVVSTEIISFLHYENESISKFHRIYIFENVNSLFFF